MLQSRALAQKSNTAFMSKSTTRFGLVGCACTLLLVCCAGPTDAQLDQHAQDMKYAARELARGTMTQEQFDSYVDVHIKTLKEEAGPVDYGGIGILLGGVISAVVGGGYLGRRLVRVERGPINDRRGEAPRASAESSSIEAPV
jgi:hypothetical protein